MVLSIFLSYFRHALMNRNCRVIMNELRNGLSTSKIKYNERQDLYLIVKRDENEIR